MTKNEYDTAPGQEPQPLDLSTIDEVQTNADDDPAKSADIPRPLAALRSQCLWCCNGSALKVHLCSAKSCPLWGYRFGRKPTAAMVAEAGNHKMYPLEDRMKVAEFHARGGTVLKAIKRRCLDCSGGSKSEVRDCAHTTCDLQPFRLGENPNRKMSEEQRALAAARLKANIQKGKQYRG